MRPRHYAGESDAAAAEEGLTRTASMRPRHYAGESLPQTGRRPQGCPGFNEAPALRRGKLGRLAPGSPAIAMASMRPRHYAGESARDIVCPPGCWFASMRPRHYAGESRSPGPIRSRTATASMRPRHYAGESPSLPTNCFATQLPSVFEHPTPPPARRLAHLIGLHLHHIKKRSDVNTPGRFERRRESGCPPTPRNGPAAPAAARRPGRTRPIPASPAIISRSLPVRSWKMSCRCSPRRVPSSPQARCRSPEHDPAPP